MTVTEVLFNETPAFALQAPDGARAIVTLHGAHVVSWQPAGVQGEQLYLSPRSGFGADAAIRGGVPVVFPQFSDRGPLPRHGFARNRAWEVQAGSARTGDSGSGLVLRLVDDSGTRALWPHAFALELQLRLVGQTLDIALQCTNTGMRPWQCMAALHTYLRVHNSAQAQVSGLAGRSYWDAVDAQEKVQDEAMLCFPGEVDRVYSRVQDPIVLHDRCNDSADTAMGSGSDPAQHGLGVAPGARSVEVGHSGFADIVVWNPGAQRAATLQDMPPDGYRSMVCIESARIADPVTLGPSQSWTGVQRLSLRA